MNSQKWELFLAHSAHELFILILEDFEDREKRSPSSSVARYGRWTKKCGKNVLSEKSFNNCYLLNAQYFKQTNFSMNCPKLRVLAIEVHASTRCKSYLIPCVLKCK